MAARFRVEAYDALGSTSALCAARARAGEPDGLAVLAARQTAGRGSRGRHWDSPEGNLYLSVLLRPAELGDPGLWSLLTGVALWDALRGLLPDPSTLTLKWPNDVLFGGRKLAGVLIEVEDGALVIGMGVNLARAPAVPGRATACIAEVAPPPPPRAFADAVLQALDDWTRVLASDGRAPVLAAWQARAHPIGTLMNIRIAGTLLKGLYAGLSPEGYLLLRTDSSTRRVSAGEVLLA